ncbi:MAG: phytoene/squalene synthase family protein [Hyphomicrobiaceae bacterium]
MRGEPDRYLAATLAPAEARPALAALAAFAAEIARIPATVSEAMLGEIRLQWWRDALANGREGRLSGHPVADALVGSSVLRMVPADLLEGMIEARELDLSGGMPQDDAGLAAYLQGSEGNSFLLGLCILGAKRSEVEELAGAAGRAYGVARGLCRMPMLLHNGGVILPAERLRSAGIDPGQLATRPAPQDLADAVRIVADAMVTDARADLHRARLQARRLDRRYRPALLPLAMVEPYFKAQSSRRLLVEPAEVSPLRRVVRIGIAHVTGRL